MAVIPPSTVKEAPIGLKVRRVYSPT